MLNKAMEADHLLNCVENDANCGSLTSASHRRKPLVFQGFRGLTRPLTARLEIVVSPVRVRVSPSQTRVGTGCSARW